MGSIPPQQEGRAWERGWVRFSLGAYDTPVKRVSQRSTESSGFSLGILVSVTVNVDRIGWAGFEWLYPSIVTVLRNES